MRRLAMIVAVSALVAACGGDSGSPSDPDPELTVTLDSPEAGAIVTGSVNLSATSSGAEEVVFRVDGAEVGRDEAAPYLIVWNSATVADGVHTISAVAEAGEERAEATRGITVDNVAPVVSVTVAPSAATLQAGQTQQFNATVQGATNTSVTWQVVEGSARGTISATGLYTAPGAIPTAATATIKATSVEDPASFGTAIVTLSPTSGGLGAAEVLGIRAAYGLGTTASETARGLIEDDFGVVGAVFLASSMNGNQLTTTGTLTETQANSGQFTYTPEPRDRLIVQFVSAGRIEIAVSAFEGNLSGVTDFARYHSNLAFRITVPNRLDITIQSHSGTPGTAGRSAPETNISYQRTVTGSVVLEGQPLQINLTLAGSLFFEVDGSFAEYERTDGVQGTITGAGSSESVQESSYSHIIVSNRVVENYIRTLQNSATVGGVVFNLSNTQVKRAFAEGKVVDTDFWLATGTLARNGTQIGAVRFATAPVEGTPAGVQPGVVVDLGGGQVIQL